MTRKLALFVLSYQLYEGTKLQYTQKKMEEPIHQINL